MGCESVVTFGVLAVMAFSHLMPCGPRPLSRGFPQFPSVLGSHTNVTIPTPLKRQTDKRTRNKTRATGPGHGLPTIWTQSPFRPYPGPHSPQHSVSQGGAAHHSGKTACGPRTGHIPTPPLPSTRRPHGAKRPHL